jgi:hypothetical protein
MKSKSFALLLIFILSLIPFNPVLAGPQIKHSLDDSLLMMYTSDAILFGETNDSESSVLHNLSAPVIDDSDPDLSDATLAATLQALKDMRNELDTNCRLLVNQYRSEGKNCEADRIQATCDQKRNEINTEIGIYHDLRGDKRKAGTKVWHFLKRTGRTLWHKIGPIGRTFLKRLGPEALQIVASGGSLSGGVIKKLVKNVARSMGRERIKKAVFQGVHRLLKGQIVILQAAGVDICDPDEETVNKEESWAKEVLDGSGTIPDGTKWECADVAGPVAALLESRPNMDGVTPNHYKYDHWMIYSDDPSSLHYFYSYDNSEDWDEGSFGVITHYWSGEVEDTSVFVDEYGVFNVSLTWNEKRSASSYYASSEVPETHNSWGLIPPNNYQTVYLCDWGAREMPTGFDTLTPDNFKERCGPSGYYFECYLPGK